MSYTLCIKHSDKLLMYSQFQTKKQGSEFKRFMIHWPSTTVKPTPFQILILEIHLTVWSPLISHKCRWIDINLWFETCNCAFPLADPSLHEQALSSLVPLDPLLVPISVKKYINNICFPLVKTYMRKVTQNLVWYKPNEKIYNENSR